MFMKDFYHNLDCNPYTSFVGEMVAKCNLYKKRKIVLQTLTKKLVIVCMVEISENNYTDLYKRVIESWMEKNFDDSVKEWWTLKTGNLFVKV